MFRICPTDRNCRSGKYAVMVPKVCSSYSEWFGFTRRACRPGQVNLYEGQARETRGNRKVNVEP